MVRVPSTKHRPLDVRLSRLSVATAIRHVCFLSLVCVFGLVGVTFDAHAQSQALSAQDRAQQILQSTGAQTTLPDENDDYHYRHGRLKDREGSIPRKIDPKYMPDLTGCNKPPDSSLGGCGSCGGCQGPALPADISTAARIVGVILAVVVFLAGGTMMYRIWRARERAPRGAQSVHTLIQQAQKLSPTAVQDALAVRDYNQAIHALFLLTLIALVESGMDIRPAWTPREITQWGVLHHEQREQLATLVTLAEYAQFSSYKSSKEDFERAERSHKIILASVRDAS